MKYIPNIITSLRILFSLTLLFVEPFTTLFYVIYFICGGSDIVDGHLARKMNCSSLFGAMLDSVADVVFIAIMLIVLIPLFSWPVWVLWWIGMIVLIRIFSLIAGFIKYRALCFLHTYANKASGLLLFCFPFLHGFIHWEFAVGILCAVAMASALEEFFLHIFSVKLDRDIKGLLWR